MPEARSRPKPTLRMEQIIAALARVPLFARLQPAQVTALAQHVVPRHLEPDQILFSEGDPCQGLYVVYSGAVRIFTQSPRGREQVLTVERAGGIVAELPVLDGGPYPATAKVLEPSLLLFISKENFRRSIQDDPGLALCMLESIGGRLRRLVMIIEELSFLSVRNRLAGLLAGMAREAAAKNESSRLVGLGMDPTGTGPIRLRLSLTQQEMAARIGTVRELISRNLGRLQAEGLIRMEGHEVIVQDVARLEQEAIPAE